MIELATEEEHLAGAEYLVHCNHTTVAADTVDEVWAILGQRSFGSIYSVSSPAGRNVRQFVPY